MAVQTILFLGNKTHITETGVGITAKSFNAGTTVAAGSATQNGYSATSVRDPSYNRGHKAPDNNVYDNDLEYDLGDASLLGAGAMYVAIAYDARGSDQLLLKLYQDVGDSPTGSFATLKATFTVDPTRPTSDYKVIATSGSKRYWRLRALQADRGGGTKMPVITGFGLFGGADVVNIDTDYPHASIGVTTLESISGVGILEGVGVTATNRNEGETQRFNLHIEAPQDLWENVLRDKFFELDGPARAWWMQFQGIRNDALANFGLLRLEDQSRSAVRPLQTMYDTNMRLRTERWV